jgi:hypothetical protein
VARHCENNPSSAFAYFFFDGRDGQKNLQQVDSLIRSLIEQFVAPYQGIPVTLAKLYQSCHNGRSQPSVESLQSTLFTILEAFDDVYIIVDALDECAERKELLEWIKDMMSWRKGKLHLSGTSRPVEDIAKYLRSLDPTHVCMMEDIITYDIEKYIDSILHQDNAFEHWDNEVKATIKNQLLENAGGMYVSQSEKSDYGLTFFLVQGSDWFRCRWMSCKPASTKTIWRFN